MPGDAAIEMGSLGAWCLTFLGLGVALTVTWTRPRWSVLGLGLAVFAAVGVALLLIGGFMGSRGSDAVFFTVNAMGSAALVGAALLLLAGSVVVVIRRAKIS